MTETRRNVGIKPHEQERLDDLALEINKLRLDKKRKPLMDTTILHELIDLAFDFVQVSPEGNIYFEDVNGNKDYRKLPDSDDEAA